MSGEKNKLFLSIENKAKKNATITRVTGLFLDSKNKPTHNVSFGRMTHKFGVLISTQDHYREIWCPCDNRIKRYTPVLVLRPRCPCKQITPLAYTITHTVAQPGDRKLSLTLEHVTDGKVYQVQAYDGIVSVVNPPISIFDFQMSVSVNILYAHIAYLTCSG